MPSGLLTDFRNAAELGPVGWNDLARAVIELALASRKLGSRSTSKLLGSPSDAFSAATAQSLSTAQQGLVTRVAYAIPRMGVRVPWRADCLVQALAARHWLARYGVGSALCIGVRRGAEFAAHAWLKVGDDVITGGDIAGYVPLLTPESSLPSGLAVM